jgi:predicted transcriptional regulator of viral defense system
MSAKRNTRAAAPGEIYITPDIPAQSNSRGQGLRESYVVRSIDRRIARIAARQCGLVTRRQLLAAGLRSSAITERIAAGKLHPLYRGVYLVGHAVPPAGAQAMGAILACGPGAVISHGSAAHLFGLTETAPAEIHVSVPGVSRRGRQGIRLHRPTTLGKDDVGVFDGVIPITSPARTLIDLAPTTGLRELERAVHEAQLQKLATADVLRVRLDGQRGARALAAVLATDPVRTKSDGESRLYPLIRKAGFPRPEVDVKLHGFEWDFVWRDQRVAVEADSQTYHSLPRSVERDRRKEAVMRSHDYEVLRFSWTQIAHQPEIVIAGIAAALERGRRR